MKKKTKKTQTLIDTSRIGILEWFRPGEYDRVEESLKDLKTLGITHLRTGISWADWYVEGTEKWYDWLFKTLSKEVEILPCVLYTPPSIGEEAKTSSPPKDLKAFADFIDIIITRYDKYFEWIELWNEPNNIIEYDFTMDYSWNKFSKMIGMAAYWAQKRGKKTVLGGMSPIDPNWLRLMAEKNTLQHIDAIGIHGFPQTFDLHWKGWEENIRAIRSVLKEFQLEKEIWITEAGFSTWQFDEVKQFEEFKKAVHTSADRVYWYSLHDLDSKLPTVAGFHTDEREYFFGLKTANNQKKLLYRLIESKGLKNIFDYDLIQKNYKTPKGESYILITGGAGFVGVNLADSFLCQGKRVMILDNLSRAGVFNNLEWLAKKYPSNLLIQIADIREKGILKKVVSNAEAVFHFSAQVAVTTSVVDPEHDFDINLEGTFNVLEAIRKSKNKPPIIFTSTNKVYGNLREIEYETVKTRIQPTDKNLQKRGVNETQNLDFHSPYGCSKGAADQYVLDYCKSFGLKSVVFRMSCIYGLHQFGNEDQGWVAHFLISALSGNPITIYGNGKQVRDILFIHDLVRAFQLALKKINTLSGEVFNIGGGPDNTVSLIELLKMIEKLTGNSIDISFEDWRVGDQYYYVSDTSKFEKATGWKANYSVEKGVRRLMDWLLEHREELQLVYKQQTEKNIAV